jgi:regulator of replication initiation timing
MNKAETIELLKSENWTGADAIRAIEFIDFNTDPDELTIRRTISERFVGNELKNRQSAQGQQRRLVTIKTNQVEQLKQQYQADVKQLNLQIELLNQQIKGADSPDIFQKIALLEQQNEVQKNKIKELDDDNRSFVKVNDLLKQDNKHLKNIVDAIRLQIAQDMKGILKYQDGDLRQAILKLFKSTQG